MGQFSSDIIRLLQALLPGFLTAWIYYALTPHRKPSEFERVIQALVLTSIIQALVLPVRVLLTYIGDNSNIDLGTWTEESHFLWSMVFAFGLGLIMSWCVTQDWLHTRLRSLGLTTKTAHPSEWYSAFLESKTDIILDMKSGRRLRGWPVEFPDHPDQGQFRLSHASWLLPDGTEVDLGAAECVVVQATDVELVEFIRCPTDTTADTKKAPVTGYREKPTEPKELYDGSKAD